VDEIWWSAAAGNTSKFTYSHDTNQGNGLLLTEVSEQANYPASSTVANRVGFQYDALARVISTTDWLEANSKTESDKRC